jgi:hypothetical protein
MKSYSLLRELRDKKKGNLLHVTNHLMRHESDYHPFYFILSVMLLGCIEKPETQQKAPQATPTETHQTQTPATKPKDTPPLPAVNILPPALEIGLFMYRYNNRDLDGLLETFSDKIKAGHPVEDFEKELEFADNHSIKIDGWIIFDQIRHTVTQHRTQ